MITTDAHTPFVIIHIEVKIGYQKFQVRS